MSCKQNYHEFLTRKRTTHIWRGIERANFAVPLFDFQRDIVTWALRKGKACIFAHTGLGKTAMQLTWASEVAAETAGNVLILAPLTVAEQTVREAGKFGIPITRCREQVDVQPGVNITNYEMLPRFDGDFAGVVLDESSILKAYDSKTRAAITARFKETPFKLACTATPSPNDHMELGNHAEFMDVMTRTEMFATYFVHDGGSTSKWRLKGHAVRDFWNWVASWAVMLSHPRDLGYTGHERYDLPGLHLHPVTVAAEPGQVIHESPTLSQRREARRSSLPARVAATAAIVNQSLTPWVVWCDLNDESKALARAIPGCVEVTGSDKPEKKTAALEAFRLGQVRVLVSKPSICGFGLNWQHCAHQAFVGLSDSFEQYYQAVRRCWRFGQKRPCHVYVVTSPADGPVVANIQRKEAAFQEMLSGMIAATQEIQSRTVTQRGSVYTAAKPIQLPLFLEAACSLAT